MLIYSIFISERISDRQIIVPAAGAALFKGMYMYVYIDGKFRIVGSVKHNCTAACALRRKVSPTSTVESI